MIGECKKNFFSSFLHAKGTLSNKKKIICSFKSQTKKKEIKRAKNIIFSFFFLESAVNPLSKVFFMKEGNDVTGLNSFSLNAFCLAFCKSLQNLDTKYSQDQARRFFLS